MSDQGRNTELPTTPTPRPLFRYTATDEKGWLEYRAYVHPLNSSWFCFDAQAGFWAAQYAEAGLVSLAAKDPKDKEDLRVGLTVFLRGRGFHQSRIASVLEELNTALEEWEWVQP
jgi:hypothetical protein